MAARSLEQLRNAFADDKVAAAFARGFIEVYAATSVGSLPKTEIDQRVFSLLLQRKVIDAHGMRGVVAPRAEGGGDPPLQAASRWRS